MECLTFGFSGNLASPTSTHLGYTSVRWAGFWHLRNLIATRRGWKDEASLVSIWGETKMAASVWAGYFTFGLISMPVRLVSGAGTSRISVNPPHRTEPHRW